jgi:hypothetical protein
MPTDPKLIEAVVLALVESDPLNFERVDEYEVTRATNAIKRAGTPTGRTLRDTVTRKHFLCACLDLTEHLTEERLIVAYGYRRANTTDVGKIHHVRGQARSVSVPKYVEEEIRKHHRHATDAEVIVFHNHPRTGDEPDLLYILKSLLDDLPIASSGDRIVLQRHGLNTVTLLRRFLGQGRVLFFLGESGYVREFRLPRVLPLLSILSQMSAQQRPGP